MNMYNYLSLARCVREIGFDLLFLCLFRSFRLSLSHLANIKKKPVKQLFKPFYRFFGADEQIRTVDLFLTKEVLCLLSYISVLTCRSTCFIISDSQANVNTFFHFFCIILFVSLFPDYNRVFCIFLAEKSQLFSIFSGFCADSFSCSLHLSFVPAVF